LLQLGAIPDALNQQSYLAAALAIILALLLQHLAGATQCELLSGVSAATAHANTVASASTGITTAALLPGSPVDAEHRLRLS
jgi:hypothetical protein